MEVSHFHGGGQMEGQSICGLRYAADRLELVANGLVPAQVQVGKLISSNFYGLSETNRIQAMSLERFSENDALLARITDLPPTMQLMNFGEESTSSFHAGTASSECVLLTVDFGKGRGFVATFEATEEAPLFVPPSPVGDFFANHVSFEANCSVIQAFFGEWHDKTLDWIEIQEDRLILQVADRGRRQQACIEGVLFLEGAYLWGKSIVAECGFEAIAEPEQAATRLSRMRKVIQPLAKPWLAALSPPYLLWHLTSSYGAELVFATRSDSRVVIRETQ